MKVYVILKQTFDTEEKIVIANGRVLEEGVKFIINPYDEYAVEKAIRIREQSGGQVVVISVGPKRSSESLRTALAMGADEAVLISDDRVSQDEYVVSSVLAAYFADKTYDLILGGHFSIDNGAGQVAVRLAELLQIPHVSSVIKLELPGGNANVTRDAEGDLEVLQVSLPALFTAQQGLNEPRYPSLPGIMKAKKKPFQQLTLDDLTIAAEALEPKTSQIELFLPPAREAGQILQGELPEQAAKLVELLRTQSKVI
ncbi:MULTISPECIES: electron transfer flavoprotein subunit beta/FixA family protein [unclassified Paenibacillus]|uniref:electron transfer flavoprotein subunit beta/FixA family protein n=1 Tax=unclassified Paenibacillus TaxID=185978 RepID=UPI001AE9BECA|nr:MULTISPECIES: electron transfer flavoprotein subunit beta/FixA family protein [unclassified Paenibacillus]MBP1157267.1 electron transfer flavoprotein beta subunit [Paenibacillus sp. PvP091]MBP1171994.1 electron transfer flavoprotein beta subunit [Paenibacillus sp. PvR098]MBP2438375.1 electron transfer flavoprotein beta subunit [Paenibacillus sp. PvP052]